MIPVSPDHKRILITNVASGTISFLEKEPRERHEGSPQRGPAGNPGPPPGPGGPPGPGEENWEQTLVAVGRGTEGFDLAPKGDELWAADAQDGSIAIVDVATKKVVRRIEANLQGANRLKFSPDGKWVLVSSLRGGDLTVFDSVTPVEVKRIPIGHGAAGIVVQPDSQRAYVACLPDGWDPRGDGAGWPRVGDVTDEVGSTAKD